MILNHYSSKPIKELYSVNQSRHKELYWSKPTGLWLSDDNDFGWKEWCAGEGFRDTSNQYKYEVDVDMSEVLHISNAEELQEFSDEYGRAEQGFSLVSIVDWSRLSKTHKGIIITPYLWSMRLSFLSWYYGWDCASGCIWDVSAINDFNLIEQEEKKRASN